MAERDFSANMNAFMNGSMGLPTEEGGGEKKPATSSDVPADAIPRPDYGNSVSRLRYAQKFREKYGDQVQGLGDTPINVNEVPRGGKMSSKSLSTKMGAKYDIDPALLYSSSMVEGMSGLFKNKATGKDSRNRKEGDPGYLDFYGDHDFPINGANSFGLNTIEERLPELIKKGYLPKDFSKNFRGKEKEGQFSSWDFKNTETAMQAKAALLKHTRDEVDDFAKEHNIELSPKAREFFMLAGYNGGEGGFKTRMLKYQKSGLLEDDKFLKSRPDSESKVKGTKDDVYGHVSSRMVMRDALSKEGYF